MDSNYDKELLNILDNISNTLKLDNLLEKKNKFIKKFLDLYKLQSTIIEWNHYNVNNQNENENNDLEENSDLDEKKTDLNKKINKKYIPIMEQLTKMALKNIYKKNIDMILTYYWKTPDKRPQNSEYLIKEFGPSYINDILQFCPTPKILQIQNYLKTNSLPNNQNARKNCCHISIYIIFKNITKSSRFSK